MTLVRELFNNVANIPLQVSVNYQPDNRWYFHKEIEIGYVISGNGDLRIEGDLYQLKENSIFLINPYSMYLFSHVASEPFVLLLLKIDPTYFNQYYPNIHDLSFQNLLLIDPQDKKLRILQTFIATIAKLSIECKEYYLYKLITLLHAMLLFLITDFAASADQVKSHGVESERIRRLVMYIDENYYKNWSLNNFAKDVGLNPQYLSRLFRQSIGLPLTKYINSVRIQKSVPDLVSSNGNISEIAKRHGFHTVKSYYSVFSEVYNMPPGQFKKQVRYHHPTEPPLTPYRNDFTSLFDSLFHGLDSSFQKISEFIQSNILE